MTRPHLILTGRIDLQRAAISEAHRATRASLRLIEELRREVGPGFCPFCEAPIPTKRVGRCGAPRKYCGSAQCKRDWNRVYIATIREDARAARGGR